MGNQTPPTFPTQAHIVSTLGAISHIEEDYTKPYEIYEQNPVVKRIIDSIRDGMFSYGDKDLFQPIVDDLLNENDTYLLLLDLESYLDCQKKIGQEFRNKKLWTEKSILNVARMGKFSSDRTIKDYARDIWGIKDV